MAIPVTENLTIYQGSTYTHVIPITIDDVVVPLTGYTARMQIRSSKVSTTVLYDSTTLGDLSVDAGTATVTLELPASVSSTWSWTTGVYDIELVDASSKPYRIMQGRVDVDAEVTR